MRSKVGVACVLVLVVAGGGVAFGSPYGLSAAGPTSVVGTPATAVYPIANDPVREIRYVDRKMLIYRFTLHNRAPVPVTVTGFQRPEHEATMLRIRGISAGEREPSFTLGPGADRAVSLSVLMTACERVSSRAGSMIGEVALTVRGMGVLPRTVTVRLPERVRTQSPRDASCPRSNTATRSPG